MWVRASLSVSGRRDGLSSVEVATGGRARRVRTGMLRRASCTGGRSEGGRVRGCPCGHEGITMVRRMRPAVGSTIRLVTEEGFENCKILPPPRSSLSKPTSARSESKSEAHTNASNPRSTHAVQKATCDEQILLSRRLFPSHSRTVTPAAAATWSGSGLSISRRGRVSWNDPTTSGPPTPTARDSRSRPINALNTPTATGITCTGAFNGLRGGRKTSLFCSARSWRVVSPLQTSQHTEPATVGHLMQADAAFSGGRLAATLWGAAVGTRLWSVRVRAWDGTAARLLDALSGRPRRCVAHAVSGDDIALDIIMSALRNDSTQQLSVPNPRSLESRVPSFVSQAGAGGTEGEGGSANR